MDTTDRRGSHSKNICHIVATLVRSSMFTSHIWFNSGNNPVAYNVDQRNIVPGRHAALLDVPSHEPAQRPTTTP
jgi:hypothetical protein